MAERASLSKTNVSALFEVLKTLRGLSSGSWGQKKNLRALFYCSFSWRIQISHLQQHLRTTVHHHNKFLVYIYTHTHIHTHWSMYIVCASDFYSFTADFVIYVSIYICVCVWSHFCIVLFHARQILMPQPILIAPRGPHRFIPSGEGASPSPFGPLNARGCVCEPPCGGPPWPPLLPWPRKTKNQRHVALPRFVVSELFFGNFSPMCPVHIRLPQAFSSFCLRVTLVF